MIDFLNNRTAIIVISLIWGFGLALLFRRVCNNDQCIIVKVPQQFHKEGDIIYDKNNRCYRLMKYPYKCTY
uniref:Uncharacterized protein n=1 Tax=viral metagenome TaxID=1070528 RepID=A0A6C0LSU9_9ZZZZ